MSNSDYLIKAVVKKLSEKINQTFLEKLDEAAFAAQEAPELIRKEFETLKSEIIEEANRLEKESIIEEEEEENLPNHSESHILNITSKKINSIKLALENLNKKLDS